MLEEQKRYPDENLAAIYAIQLLLLTGCRKNEILKLKWSYFNQDQGCLMLPDSKTGAKTIYLGAPTISLLHEIKNHPARPTDNPYVIWGKKADTHLVNIRTPWLRFRKLAGLENEDLENVRIHDLRHSFGSMAASGSRLSLP